MAIQKHTSDAPVLESVPVAEPQPAVESRPAESRSWTPAQRFWFRVAFIFFTVFSIPTTLDWYANVLSFDWLHLHYRDLYEIARFSPSLLRYFGVERGGGGEGGGRSPLLGYEDWFVLLGIALVGAVIWTALDRKRREYDILYYWLRTIVRYRAGIGIIGFGFTKLFPTQMPYPSEGLLNTDFGDFTAQKIFWMSVGIVPWYQVFTGFVEILAGAMLFFRGTTTIGAALLFGALGDIVFVNFAYDGGVHVYSSYFVLMALFLMIYDARRVYNLLVLERFTVPIHFYPDFSKGWLKYLRIGLKTATIAIFLVWFTWLEYINFNFDPYKQPAMKGVTALRGLYNVTEFRLNNKVIPYSPTDTVRWQSATFEKWSSLTFKVNKPTRLDLSNGGGAPMRDLNRTFEVSGVAGGRRVFYYDADTVDQVLYLQDKIRKNNRATVDGKEIAAGNARKNREKPEADQWIPKVALARIGSEVTRIDPRGYTTRRERGIAEETRPVKRNRMILKYSTTDGSRVILTGVDERKDSIYVVLDRVNRKYALSESSLQAGKY
ncbi:hypothetical protein [Larkinella soli]|uniref:hypothetical protein n=1 Tax=Larkinella soli TaxID=1770527 RepID=UPI001E52E1F4|nr:hypothetical protein [Larkinella soli]